LSFGEGIYSATKKPVNTYSKAGKYTVGLRVKNVKGSNTKTIAEYVVVVSEKRIF
jgi:PKD repeat protein